MKKVMKILMVAMLFFLSAKTVRADIAPPSKLTTFYFQKNGQPVTEEVEFNIKCYGVSLMRNEDGFSESSELLKISELSETCASYGCEFDTSNIFEIYRKNVRYCDLEGNIGDKKFRVNKFLNDSLSELNCHPQDYAIGKSDGFYKETPQYDNCRRKVYKEYYPQGNGKVKGDFLCNKYKTDNDLIPTALSTEQNGPCYRYGYIIKNNICYKIPDEFFACTAEEERKLEICEQYLENVTSKLVMDKNKRPFGEICEIKIDIPNNMPLVPIEQSRFKIVFGQIIVFFERLFEKFHR